MNAMPMVIECIQRQSRDRYEAPCIVCGKPFQVSYRVELLALASPRHLVCPACALKREA